MGKPSYFRLILLAVLVVTASSLPVFLLAAAFFDIGPELGLSTFGLGALTSAFFLTAAATSAPLGRWVEQVGWQMAMRINLTASAGIMILIAVAADQIWVLAILMVLAAAVYGMSNPSANQALADRTRPGRQATVFGMKHAGIPSATLLAGLAVPVVVLRFGWRWAFVAAALLAMAVALAVPRSRVTPRDHPEPEVPVQPLGARWLLWLALGSSFATWAAVALGTYLITAAVDIGFSEAAAGWLQFAGSAISITVRVGAGLVTDRVGSHGYGGIVILSAIGAGVFALLPLASGPLFAGLVILAFATGWGWPGLMTYVVVRSNRSSAASSSAITQAGVLFGAGVGPLVLGAVITRWSFDGAWVAVALALAVAATVVSVIRRLVPRGA